MILYYLRPLSKDMLLNLIVSLQLRTCKKILLLNQEITLDATCRSYRIFNAQKDINPNMVQDL